ncbi:hypothetical protein [Halocatena salina]|uniref:Uncharacterized protein n=1 Tax=Halocatena salina TaxID=2934340 RepID=A0A8U0A083_9EURY|nr:hypothetical protein [Halocatena salina]UPM42510.1 hypothetical protein MW046_11165 [Halocatena salina]
MSVSGLCELCTQNEIVDGCDRCGRLVCERHYDEASGFCTDCLTEVEPTDDDTRQPDDVDTYRV